MEIKRKIAKWLRITEADVKANDYYSPKKFGEGKTICFEIDGLSKSFCQVTEWTNGEGYDISFQTISHAKLKIWEDKRISLHTDELECMLACLNDFKYFDND